MFAAGGGIGVRGFGRRLGRAVVTAAVAGASLASMVAIGAGPAGALPGDRLVNPVTGNNVGDCTVNKCKTIVYAHTQAVAGNRIVLDAGDYLEKPTITKAITIEGAGQATTRIGTATLTAGITLTVTAGAANTVTLNGVTIRNGVGGLFVNTGKVVVNDSTVTNNTGTTVGAGVIVNVAPNEITMTNTTVSNNIANNGGGIFTFGGKITMTGGQVINNTANAVSGSGGTGFGGGIFSGSTAAPFGLTLNGVTVSGNKANAVGTTSANGGGIAHFGTASITNSTITGNQANSVGTVVGNGGGIYNTGSATVAGTVTLTDTAVTGNTATNGAGILNLNFAAAGAKVTVNGGQVSNNTATAIAGNANTGFGGGVYSLATGVLPLTLSNVSVNGNKAVPAGTVIGTGGGVYTGTPSKIDGGTTVSNNTATNGGGVFSAAAMTLGPASVTGNAANPVSGVASSGFGGGIHNTGTGVVTSTTGTFTNNTGANGGGIYNLGKVTATGGAISDNTITAVGGLGATGFGGGVYSVSSASPALTLSGIAIERNKAKNSTSGAAVAGNAGGILNLGAATIATSSFTDNTAEGSAAALYNFSGTATISSTPFTGNSSPGVGGTILDAATSVGGNPTLKLTDSPITAAGTAFLGGGLAVGAASRVEVTGGSIANGTALGGGGIFVFQQADPPSLAPGGIVTLDSTDITGNSAPAGFGGAIFNGGKVTGSDLEISDNSAAGGLGGAVYSVSSPTANLPVPTPPELTLSRVTLAGNSASSGSGITANGPTTVRNSTVNGNASTSASGALVVSGTTTLENDTIVGNTATGAGSVGGVVGSAGNATITGSIVALNGGNCSGAITDGGDNLTDTVSPAAGACPFTTNAVIGDPQLNALGNNTGPTRTMLPKNNSPAINEIPVGPACPSIDQRGITRPQGTNCDIGSVELEGIVAPTLAGPDHALFIIGTPNSVGFTYTGVPEPTLSTTGDPLPSGVTLTDNDDGTATLGGTAATGTAGVYNFTIKAANGESPAATIDFTLTVIAPLVITTTSLPDGEISVAYNSSVQATGGTTPYTWSIDSGSLPAGLSLNPATGAITGTPTGPDGVSNFTVKVVDSTTVDSMQQSATKPLSISIKTATTLSVHPAILRLNFLSLKLSIINASATLTKAPGNLPVAGQTIRFTTGANQAPLCTAVTDANGFAKCGPVQVSGILAVLLANGYDGFFDGTATLKPSSGHGVLATG